MIFLSLLVLPLYACNDGFNEPNTTMATSEDLNSTKYFLHQHHQNNYQEIKNDSDSGKELIGTPYKPDTSFHLDYEVFGWYPFWEEDEHKLINYSLLSTLAYFSYEVDPSTGKPKTIHDWKTTPIVDSAKVHKLDMLLTITNFGRSNNKEFLTSKKARATLIKTLISLIQLRKAQGVSVDFEGVGRSEKDDLTSFIAELNIGLKRAEALTACTENYKLYLSLPAVDAEAVFDVENLVPSVDTFVIMGYDYYGSFSKTAGPVAPLESGELWTKDNLENSVQYYKNKGVLGRDLLLALPFYGSVYETTSNKKGAAVSKFVGSKSYSYFAAKIDSTKALLDVPSSTAWYSEENQTGNGDFTQYWFDNYTALNHKLEFIKKDSLKGMGIWALGYDAGNHDLWGAIEHSFHSEKLMQHHKK